MTRVSVLGRPAGISRTGGDAGGRRIGLIVWETFGPQRQFEEVPTRSVGVLAHNEAEGGPELTRLHQVVAGRSRPEGEVPGARRASREGLEEVPRAGVDPRVRQVQQGLRWGQPAQVEPLGECEAVGLSPELVGSRVRRFTPEHAAGATERDIAGVEAG
jgi:hypothetical protein